MKSINNGVASGFLWQSRPTSGSWEGNAELTCSFLGKDLGTAKIIFTDYDNFIVAQKCQPSWVPGEEEKFRQMIGIHVRNSELTEAELQNIWTQAQTKVREAFGDLPGYDFDTNLGSVRQGSQQGCEYYHSG